MNYYSTNRQSPEVSIEEAVLQGLAPDGGLYMPNEIRDLPKDFLDGMATMSFCHIAQGVAESFFGGDVASDNMKQIVKETLSFDIPLVQVSDNKWSLELFHGPTAAFKDVGARFMARMLSLFIEQKRCSKNVTVLVATSGDTGSAVANGFLDVEGILVVVLYPKGKVSDFQEKQFTTLGKNIRAVAIDGTFDDCQRLVKEAFLDGDLNKKLTLTSANSINVARFMPQVFYYFWGVAQLLRAGVTEQIVVSVPSGNLGNLTAGLFAKKMGLCTRFIAANNSNDFFMNYLRTGQRVPRISVQTIANAMDVGDPGNFARILDLYGSSWEGVKRDVVGFGYSDKEIMAGMKRVYSQTGYMLDPHGACGYLALEDGLQPGETGIFLETAAPAKFMDTVEEAIGVPVPLPNQLTHFLIGIKQSVDLPKDFLSFKNYLRSL